MKRLWSSLIIASLCAFAYGQPGPVPGTQPVDQVFASSDVVCTCKILSTTIENEEPQQPPPNVLRHVRAVVEVEDAFKPDKLSLGEQLTVRFVQQYPMVSTALPGVRQSETSILFLKKTADGSYEFADRWMGAKRFQLISRATSGNGLSKLESALLNTLAKAQPGGPYHDDLRALYMLEGFPVLSSDGMAAMAKFANSSEPNIALAAIGTMMKSRSPQAVQLLKNYLISW